jgi:hypothetical protein
VSETPSERRQADAREQPGERSYLLCVFQRGNPSGDACRLDTNAPLRVDA